MNSKSPKRAQDPNSGFPKRRKQNETASARRPELPPCNPHETVSTYPNPAMDVDNYQVLATSSQESMDTSASGSDATAQDLIGLRESFAENVLLIDVDFSKKASKEEAGLSKVLEAETAMRNTCGGVIILNSKNKEQRDQWLSKLQELRSKKLSQVRNPDTFDDILDLKEFIIFVRKSSIVLTEESRCLLQRCEQRNERVTSYPEICSILKKTNTICCCKSDQSREMERFILGNKMPFPESKTAEFKHLTGNDFPTSLRKKLREYIIAFANTAGGTIYFGIQDDASIIGQKVSNLEELEKICRFIEECMSSKLWIQDSGEKVDPVKDSHYRYDFYSVDGADDDTVVVRVHICKFSGTVFSGEPVCHMLNEDNKKEQMDFEKWLTLHKPCLTGNNDYQMRFEKRKRGTSTYLSVKETVEKFVAELTSASPGQLKLHPSHAVNWINHPALEKFIRIMKKNFKENKWRSGIAYIERCWKVNLGLPSTKPDDVICDILLCCPQMPLVFVSLTRSDTPDEFSRSYNRKVAARLKATLVQEANCLEKFYVKPLVISLNKLDVEGASFLYSESPLYPEVYRMSDNKYSNILEALVLVLARANVMSSHIVGQGLFNLLTYEQYDLLHEYYEDSEKVKISGPPGSGKTVLALERIHRLRKGGCTYDQIYFLCSNKPLKACKGREYDNGT